MPEWRLIDAGDGGILFSTFKSEMGVATSLWSLFQEALNELIDCLLLNFLDHKYKHQQVASHLPLRGSIIALFPLSRCPSIVVNIEIRKRLQP